MEDMIGEGQGSLAVCTDLRLPSLETPTEVEVRGHSSYKTHLGFLRTVFVITALFSS